MKFEPVNLKDDEGNITGIKRDPDTGWPVVLVEGQDGQKSEVPFDIDRQHQSLSEANTESKQRRQALQAIAQHLGLKDIESISTTALEAITAKAEEVGGAHADLSQELSRLKKLEAAGKLDATAEDKIKQMAANEAKETVLKFERQVAEANTRAQELETKLNVANKTLRADRNKDAIAKLYSETEAMRPDALRTVEAAALAAYNWVPTGEVDDKGVPEVVAVDDTGSPIKLNELEPRTLRHWFTTEAPATHPALFKKPNGSAPPGSFGAINAEAASWADMDQHDAERAVNAAAEGK